MADLDERLRAWVQQASGRCHSCVHQHAYDLPTGSRFWCRAFGVELSQEERDEVRDCPRWQPFRPLERNARSAKALKNPLLRDAIEAEDKLFWRLKQHLDRFGLDLKTLMVVAHEPLTTTAGLDWVDGLDQRFDSEDPGSLAEVLETLRALGYTSLCQMVERVLRPGADA